MTRRSSLRFGSLFAYTPREISTLAFRQALDFRSALKGDRFIGDPPSPATAAVAAEARRRLPTLPFADFFAPDVALVPVPSSSLMRPGTLWVPLNLATALQHHHLGTVLPLLRRARPLRKAATAGPGLRPAAADNEASLELSPSLDSPRRILLVDDVITRGATLLGTARFLQDQYPEATIHAFAALRAVSPKERFQPAP